LEELSALEVVFFPHTFLIGNRPSRYQQPQYGVPLFFATTCDVNFCTIPPANTLISVVPTATALILPIMLIVATLVLLELKVATCSVAVSGKKVNNT